MNNNNTVGSQFKQLQVIHIALCVVLAVILATFRYISKNLQDDEFTENKLFEFIGIAVGFFAVLAARFVFFFKTKSALSAGTLKEKLDIFKTAYITQMGILEGAAIFNAALYFITHYNLHLFIALGILLLMALRRPTRAIAVMVLFSGMEDRQQLYNDQLEL